MIGRQSRSRSAAGSRLRKSAIQLDRMARTWGVDVRQAARQATHLTRVFQDRKQLRLSAQDSPYRDDFQWGPSYVIATERDSEATSSGGHYLWQDLLVAQDIFRRSPRRHVDVGSSIYGFVSHVASFREVEVLDIRPLTSELPGVMFVQGDLLSDSLDIPPADSVSCLHALEHIGLGRYGDAVDFDGWAKGLDALGRLVQPGGTLYLSVPTGEVQRIEFNAHRVFSLAFLRDVIRKDFEIESVHFLGDCGEVLMDIDVEDAQAERSFGATYGCSIWTLCKREEAIESLETRA